MSRVCLSIIESKAASQWRFQEFGGGHVMPLKSSSYGRTCMDIQYTALQPQGCAASSYSSLRLSYPVTPKIFNRGYEYRAWRRFSFFPEGYFRLLSFRNLFFAHTLAKSVNFTAVPPTSCRNMSVKSTLSKLLVGGIGTGLKFSGNCCLQLDIRRRATRVQQHDPPRRTACHYQDHN